MMRVPAARIVPVLRWHLERDGIQTSDDARLEQIVLNQRERVKTVREMAQNSAFFFRAPGAYDEKAVKKHVTPEVLAILERSLDGFRQLPNWDAPAIHAFINETATGTGLALGKLAQPLRIALCGGTVSPPIDATLAILGREEALARLSNALAAWRA
jgi:glutamyl-tRNA synthetase